MSNPGNTSKGQGPLIGHLDTGVDAAHPALQGKLVSWLSLDKNGIAHATEKPVFFGSHGTHTAGIICADPYEGISGLAPDARLHVVAMQTRGKTLLKLLGGMDALLRMDIRIACMPVGVHKETPIFDPFMLAFRQKNILPISPIGNSGGSIGYSPACHPDALTVGAVDQQGRVASFSSNWSSGPTIKPELLAPGSLILSAIPGGKTQGRSGTSMACAWVAGAAARLLQVRPEASAAQIQQVLCDTALPPDKAHRCRYGIAQLEAALAAIQQDPLPMVEPSAIPVSSQFKSPYIDPHFLKKLRRARAGARLEAIVLPKIAVSAERGSSQSPHSERLVREVAQQTGSEPIAIRYFQQVDGAHIQADSAYFTTLLAHPDLWVCSAVDINIFDHR